MAATPRERAIVLAAADAGLRVSEVSRLRWQDIDLERWRIRVEGKGGKVARIDATARLLAALVELGPAKSGPIFGISVRRIEAIMTTLCRRAGVKSRGYHSLRHSCGTRLHQRTKDLLVTQRRLRHSDPSSTRIYAHLSD